VKRHPQVRHAPIAAALKETPGVWALVGNYVWQGAGASAARVINVGLLPSYRPAGAFEAEVRIGHEGDAFVWARYVGTQEVAA
jgi:hypothetical protein